MLFDTHAHYDDEQFDADRRELLSGLGDRGVGLVLNPASNRASAEKIMTYLHDYPFLYAAVGTHPHDAEEMKDEDLTRFEEMAQDDKVKAVGEIGLDYFYDLSPRDVQKKRLRDQLALAENLRLPVIIHDREAHEDTLNILREFPRVTGVVHCFSGSPEMARILLDMGYSLSFTGAITFKNARRALETLAIMPRERIMIETDSPYLTPVPYRGKRNDSGYVRLVAEQIARTLELTEQEVEQLTWDNGKRFFGIE